VCREYSHGLVLDWSCASTGFSAACFPGLRVCAPLVSTDFVIGCFAGGALVARRSRCVSSARGIVLEL
jgi:hypothetical protein